MSNYEDVLAQGKALAQRLGEGWVPLPEENCDGTFNFQVLNEKRRLGICPPAREGQKYIAFSTLDVEDDLSRNLRHVVADLDVSAETPEAALEKMRQTLSERIKFLNECLNEMFP